MSIIKSGPHAPRQAGMTSTARIRMDSNHRRRIRVADVLVNSTQYEMDQVAELVHEIARKPQAAAHLLRILREYY